MNVLATAAPFRLGGLLVRPATRQVVTPDGRALVAEPRVLQVLLALAGADGEVVSRDELIERCWDGRIVGEDAINRAIAKARRLAELTAPPAFTIETIPKVGYRLQAQGAAELSAALEPLQPPNAARRWMMVGGAAAVVAAAGGGVFAWRRRHPATRPYPLVAVLPFDNLSPDPKLGYFADGLSEDILNALIRGGGVRVTAPSSSFTFRGAAKAKAGGVLGADYLLDGSVLRDGDRMRVNVHLEDVASRQTLWSESYDRDVGQGLAVEDDIAGRVGAALRVRFAQAARAARVVDRAVYDLYLQGREATRVHSIDSLHRGNALLREAVARAPDFADAWFELAKNCWRAGYLESLADQASGYALGREAARRAIALDPGAGAAFGVIAEMTPNFGRWIEVDEGLTRGARLSPNDPDLVLWRGSFLFQTGRTRAAVTELRRAQALDPLELFTNHALCAALTSAAAFGEAAASAARIAAIWPEQIAAYWDRVMLLIAAGQDAEALAIISGDSVQARKEPREHTAYRATLRAILDRSERARAEAGRALLALAGEGTGYASNSLILLARLGQFEAVRRLARSLYLRTGEIAINREVQFVSSGRFPRFGEAEPSYLFHPSLAPLRRAGGLDEVFDGIGLMALWRRSGGPDA
jgi:TolB-like protein/DNA-binding winged helix-turn-helix (wHTH) protein/tetratricopeptide (TPR) repeat protein